jgi:hypothetical protein
MELLHGMAIRLCFNGLTFAGHFSRNARCSTQFLARLPVAYVRGGL